MSFPIILDTIICAFGLGLLIYYAHLYHQILIRIGLAITFIGLGFQLSRNFGYLANTFKGTIFDYGLPIWAFKELGLVVLLTALLWHMRKEG